MSQTSKPGRLPPPTMIDNPADIPRLEGALSRANRLAVDTESNSLHAYQEQVCLIQITTHEGDFLVDPLRLDLVNELPFLGEMLADPAIEKVFHAAEYDVLCLRRDYDYEIVNLFDTMVAARILGWERFGLGTILEERYGVEVDKRYQRANWGKRPLSADQVEYARLDTHYLLGLRDDLHTKLAEGGHLEEAAELFEEVLSTTWTDNGMGFDPESFWQISRSRDLDPQSAAVLRELYIFRDKAARRRDLPVFKIMGDKTLLTLAKEKPKSLKVLREVRGIGRRSLDMYGRQILRAIARGMKAPPQIAPDPPQRPADEVLERYDLLHTWRKERARGRGVSSEIVMPKSALWAMAYDPPESIDEVAAVEGIGPWRCKTYGQEIVDLLDNHHTGADE